MIKKIGLLLPKSVIYPSINFDLMAGLRAALADKGSSDIDIRTESIGVAGNDKNIYAVCEKMLMEGCKIIAGYVNPTTAEKMAPLFENGNAIFLGLDAGYHYPSSLNKISNVFYLSLQGGLGSRIIAKVAASDGNKKIAYSGSYYEAGYRSAYALYRCLEDEAGEITFNHITSLKRSEFSLAPLKEHIQAQTCDAVFTSFCGDMLQDFCKASASDNPIDIPVYGAPFVGEQQWLAQSVYPGMDIKVCVPWSKELDNPENKKFRIALEAEKQKANVFSVLGWEAGVVIAQALQGSDTDSAISLLEGFTFSGPRGRVTLNKDSHQCHAPMYDGLVTKDELTGNCKLVVTGESALTDDQHERLDNDIRTVVGGFTSWFNAYGCLES